MLKFYSRMDVVEIGMDDGGIVTGSRFQLVAEDSVGGRKVHDHCFVDEEAAFRFERRVDSYVNNGGKLDESRWSVIAPRYGSPAHSLVGDDLTAEEGTIYVGHKR